MLLSKDYRCKVCGATLIDKEHLDRHKKVHRGKPVEFGDPYFTQIVGAPQNTTLARAVSNLIRKEDKQ